MKRLFGGMVALGVAAILTARSAHADEDVLYWMMDGTEKVTNTDGTKSSVSDFFNAYEASTDSYFAARVRVTGGDISADTFLQMYYYDEELGNYTIVDGSMGMEFYQESGAWTMDSTEPNIASIGAYSSSSPEYSFIIELGNVSGDEWTTIAKSSSATYANLSAYVRETFSVNPPAAGAWNGGAFTAVPEPTSGMLMLMGLALLSLRRKRAADGV